MRSATCDCTPMCLLRTGNPMKVRPDRPDHTAGSAYRPGGAGLAERLTDYAVLANDPAVRVVAADYWLHSEPFYRDVLDTLCELTADAPSARAALQELCSRPGDIEAERRLRRLLTRLLAARPGRDAAAWQAVRAADDTIYIDYLRGEDYLASPAPVTVAGLLECARAGSRPAPAVDPEVLVVIPLMDRGGTGRLRNLLACLLALRDQTLEPARYAVSVVEFDTVPRRQREIKPLTDHYRHVYGAGAFNKSWSVNVGVRHTPGRAPILCLLDADILTDRDFLRRNLARFDDPGHDAHLPHTEMLSLDPAASDAVIAQRCYARREAPPLDLARGLLLRDVPGACLWVRRTIFERIGGLDERYLGWGGEDEDLLVRTAAAGSTVQFDDVLMHLAHERPPMRRPDGEPFNAHLTVGSWNRASGYGELTGPAVPGVG